MLSPWPKAMTAGGATKQRAAKAAIAIATRNPSPVRSALSIGQACKNRCIRSDLIGNEFTKQPPAGHTSLSKPFPCRTRPFSSEVLPNWYALTPPTRVRSALHNYCCLCVTATFDGLSRLLRVACITGSVVTPVVIVHGSMMMITTVVREVTTLVTRMNTAQEGPMDRCMQRARPMRDDGSQENNFYTLI